MWKFVTRSTPARPNSGQALPQGPPTASFIEGVYLMHPRIWKRNADPARVAGSARTCEGRFCLRSMQAICTTVLLLSFPALLPAQQIAIGEYPVPTANS